MTFEQWMALVDGQCERRAGCSVHDLPDCCFRDWFEDGVSASGAAVRAIRSARSDGAL